MTKGPLRDTGSFSGSPDTSKKRLFLLNELHLNIPLVFNTPSCPFDKVLSMSLFFVTKVIS